MDVLITGGAGFIGSNFVREFAKGEYPKISKITVLDKLTYAGDFNNIKELVNDGAIQFIQGDICDSNLIREIIGKFDAIVNFAAESHVDRSIETPNEFVLSNIVGVQNLISHVEKSGETRFLQVSTDEVYGSILTGSSIESDCLKPSSVYSASKASAELLALSSYKTHGTDVVITRSSNNFGPFQHVEKLIPNIISKVLNNTPVQIYGDGLNIRDWIFVTENCRGVYSALVSGETGHVYNIGGNELHTNLHIAETIMEIMGMTPSNIEFVEDRKGHDYRYSLNTEKSNVKLGFLPNEDFRTKLAQTIEWYLSHAQKIA
jgi:dTDP-glucose 4,6-dehydratase